MRHPSARRSRHFESLEPRWAAAGLPTISVGAAAISEGHVGQKNVLVPVTLSAATNRSVSFDYTTAGGTASTASDFKPAGGVITIPAGKTTVNIPIAIVGDRAFEADEVFQVRISRPNGATLGASAANVTIWNDDPAPMKVFLESLPAREGDLTAQFKIRLERPAAGPITFQTKTVGKSATSGVDFDPVSSNVVFEIGDQEKIVSVSLRNDTIIELDEQFQLAVRNVSWANISFPGAQGVPPGTFPSGATGNIVSGAVTSTIVDNDEVIAPATNRIVGYFPSWGVYDRDYQVDDVPADQLTHLAYAFAKVTSNGEVTFGDVYADSQKPVAGQPPGASIGGAGNFQAMRLLKQAHPNLRTLISIGGWDGSKYFSDVAATPEARAKFVASAIKFAKTHGFDGIDIDWEFPVSGGLPTNHYRPADKHNFTLLVQEVRRQLDLCLANTGKKLTLTVALGTQPDQFANYELGQLARFCDWVHMITYDYAGPWSNLTNHHSPLYDSSGNPGNPAFNIDASVRAFTAWITPAKLVIGSPAYGYAWSGVPNVNNGLFQPFTNIPSGSAEDPGSYDYRDIKANFLPTFTRYWDNDAKSPWLYNAATGTMVSYEDSESIGHRADYVVANGLGGMLLWELSADDDQHSLVDAIFAGLT